MIEIKINGNQLSLYRDTTLHIEANNTLLASDSIPGDVVYTFSVPIRGNEDVLEFSYVAHAERGKRYDCAISVGGIDMLSGSLVIQKVGHTSMEVGVVCNDYPKGWADQSVREDIDEVVDIVPENGTLETHKAYWMSYLNSTLSHTSNVKFGLIHNEENYGSDNEDFGFWNGGSVSPLVNRLFLANNHIVENTYHPFIHLFNKMNFFEESLEMNQMTFCPQFRLTDVLRKLFLSAGYRAKGDFFDNQDLADVFIQSPVALDGDISQYLHSLSAHSEVFPNDDDPRFSHIIYVSRIGFSDWVYDDSRNRDWISGPLPAVLSGRVDQSASPVVQFRPSSGNIAGSAGFVVPPMKGLYRLSFVIQIPRFQSPNAVRPMPGAVLLCNDVPSFTTDACVIEKKEYANLLDVNQPLAGEFPLTVTNADIAAGKRYCIVVAYIADNNVVRAIPYGQSIIDVSLIEQGTTPGLNIFAKSFNLGQCLPDISNSKFLNAIRKAFGLAFYLDKRSGAVEVATARNVTQSGTLDLSSFVLSRNTTLTVTPVKSTFSYAIFESATDLDPEQMLPAVQKISDLPNAAANVNKYCFVRTTNAFWHSEKVEDEETSWRWQWQKAFGNNTPIARGAIDGDETSLATDCVVPTLCEFGRKAADGTKSFIPDIPFRIESPMFGDEKGADLILLYYRGRERYLYGVGSRERTYEFESMSPVADSGFSLKTEGPESSGEQFIRPWLDIAASPDVFKYQFRLPILKALEVLDLLRPSSDGRASRWLMVDNVRTMPRKVTLEIFNTSDSILCEIEAVRPRPV